MIDFALQKSAYLWFKNLVKITHTHKLLPLELGGVGKGRNVLRISTPCQETLQQKKIKQDFFLIVFLSLPHLQISDIHFKKAYIYSQKIQ